MGMGFQFEQHRLGLWDLSWDLKKTISWEMGLGPPFTTLFYRSKDNLYVAVIKSDVCSPQSCN